MRQELHAVADVLAPAASVGTMGRDSTQSAGDRDRAAGIGPLPSEAADGFCVNCSRRRAFGCHGARPRNPVCLALIVAQYRAPDISDDGAAPCQAGCGKYLLNIDIRTLSFQSIPTRPFYG